MMKKIILTHFLVFISCFTFAQERYSSSSVMMNRSNGVVSPDQVIVEEYMNYHQHKIPIPKGRKEVALSLDAQKIKENHFVFQVGIATQSLIDYSEMPPVNVCLVIDRSGSMSSGNRLGKVKTALKKFIKGLRPKDFISIVAYSSEAEVILTAQKVGEVTNLSSIIEALTPSGSTNLHGGLMLGYKEVKKYFSPQSYNKVVLLTDGIANRGETNSEKIVEDSYEYNQQGIQVSTIGVGRDVNYTLLQQISSRGKGSNYFVGNHQEDIVKTFENELEGLLSPVGKEVYLELDFPKEVKLNHLFGYSSARYNGNKVTIPLKNINRGLTQIILFDVNVSGKTKPIQVGLKYHSFLKNKAQKIVKKMKLIPSKKMGSKYSDINKNYHIATMANALKKMAKEVQNRKYKNGLSILNKKLQEINQIYPHLKDKDLIRVKDILIKNKQRLSGYFNPKKPRKIIY